MLKLKQTGICTLLDMLNIEDRNIFHMTQEPYQSAQTLNFVEQVRSGLNIRMTGYSSAIIFNVNGS